MFRLPSPDHSENANKEIADSLPSFFSGVRFLSFTLVNVDLSIPFEVARSLSSSHSWRIVPEKLKSAHCMEIDCQAFPNLNCTTTDFQRSFTDECITSVTFMGQLHEQMKMAVTQSKLVTREKSHSNFKGPWRGLCGINVENLLFFFPIYFCDSCFLVLVWSQEQRR